MEFLAWLFVGKPQNVLAVAALLFVGYLVIRWRKIQFFRHPRWLLISSGAWALYTFWELLVQLRTPEANMRVDLLLIWPLLASITVWCLYRVFR